VTERVGRSGGGGSGRRAADASTLTPTDDDFDCNETMSIVSNCSDLQTAAQLTDGKLRICGFAVGLYVIWFAHTIVSAIVHQTNYGHFTYKLFAY